MPTRRGHDRADFHERRCDKMPAVRDSCTETVYKAMSNDASPMSLYPSAH